MEDDGDDWKSWDSMSCWIHLSSDEALDDGDDGEAAVVAASLSDCCS